MRILVFAGHTGGHLFPAIGFIECLRRRVSDSCVAFVTTQKAEKFLKGQPPYLLDALYYLKPFPTPSRLNIFSIFQFLMTLVQGFRKSLQIIREVKPDYVIGFGSFVSFPGVLLARLMRIPAGIHEQNVAAGKASQWLVPFATHVFCTFPESFHPKFSAKMLHTGLPLRRKILESGGYAERMKCTDPNHFRVLVMGGSQGSHAINLVVADAISKLSLEEKKILAVTHISGEKDFTWVQKTYKRLDVISKVFPFSDSMETLFLDTDFVICRAGANTLAELAYFGLPALMIPYPHAGGHQSFNANYFVKRQASWCISEVELSSNKVVGLIRDLMVHSSSFHRAQLKMHELAMPSAGDAIVEQLQKKWNHHR